MEYFERTIPIATYPNGLSSEISGRYEQIGYTKRTFEYLSFLCYILKIMSRGKDDTFKKELFVGLTNVIQANSVSRRPLIDNNSIPIVSILHLYMSTGDLENARIYTQEVLAYIIFAKENNDRMPDAGNSYKSVTQYILTKEKSVYYSDQTSLLLGALMEHIAILDMKEEYYQLRKFIIDNKIDIAVFVPHHRNNLCSLLIKDRNLDLEEQLFSKVFFDEGYQSEVSVYKDFHKDLSFEDFKLEFDKKIDEFNYDYRTEKSGFPYLLDLAHIYFQTPYFPNRWRKSPINL